jgi:predicted lipoprotein with Yx(FWY)xxD motif
MNTRRTLITAAVVLLAVPPAAAAVAAPAAATVAGGAGQAGQAGPAAGKAVVVSTAGSKFGRVLVTGAGRSLYVFSGDNFPFSPASPFQLPCTALNKAPNGQPCTAFWPPLVATGPLVAKNGVQQNGLGTVTRNGVKQVTYFGHPLYTFVGDTAAGQINGECVAAFDGIFNLDAPSGRAAVGVAAVQTEVSPNGIVLSSPTASGGRSVYTLSFDPKGKATCLGPCSGVWPPVLTSGPAVAGTGVSQAALGTVRRPDGSLQVSYHGHPLYWFAFDLGAGAPSGLTNGEYFIDPFASGVWYTTLPQGTPDPGTTTVGSEIAAGANILAIQAGFLHVTATLYAFTADTPTASKCTGRCALIWPPVLTTTPPAATGSANAAKLGTIPRADGTFQVTYNGHPLYFFAQALNTSTAGNGITAFGGTFKIVNVNGTIG